MSRGNTTLTGAWIDSLLFKLKATMPAELCRKHLEIFQLVGHIGTLVAGVFGLGIALVTAIKQDSFAWFIIGVAWVFAMVVLAYISNRFSAMGEVLVKGTKSFLSSAAYMEAIALLVIVFSVGLLCFGAYYLIRVDGAFGSFAKLGALAVWLFYLGVITLSSGELLNVEIRDGLKAEEEGVGLLELNAKSAMFAVPFFFGSGIVLFLINACISIYQYSRDGGFATNYAIVAAPNLMIVGWIAALPFLACVAFLLSYASIAAVKSLIRIAAATAGETR